MSGTMRSNLRTHLVENALCDCQHVTTVYAQCACSLLQTMPSLRLYCDCIHAIILHKTALGDISTVCWPNHWPTRVFKNNSFRDHGTLVRAIPVSGINFALPPVPYFITGLVNLTYLKFFENPTSLCFDVLHYRLPDGLPMALHTHRQNASRDCYGRAHFRSINFFIRPLGAHCPENLAICFRCIP